MAKRSNNSNSLIRARTRRGWDFFRGNPWRTAVIAIVLVGLTYGGYKQYQVIEAATIEQQAQSTCQSTGERANPGAAQCIADKVLIDNLYTQWKNRTPDEKQCLGNLWNRESGWRWNATNPTSGAYGIPQALPASKLASAYNNPAYGTWQDNVVTQERWGLGYISGRYGHPCAAWNHEVTYGWY